MSASRAEIAAAKRQLYGTPPPAAPAPARPAVPSTTAEEAPTMPEDTKPDITCTDCGYEAISPNGLAVHRGRAHHSGALPHANGTTAAAPAAKAPPAKAKPAKKKQAGPPPHADGGALADRRRHRHPVRDRRRVHPGRCRHRHQAPRRLRHHRVGVRARGALTCS